MIGHSHMIVGAAGFAAADPLVSHLSGQPVTLTTFVSGTVVASGWALWPDADTQNSTLGHSMGLASEGATNMIGKLFGGHRHGLVGEGEPSGRRLAVPVAGVDDLDRASAVPGAHPHLVLLAGAGVLNDVGAGLAERQGDVGAGLRRDSERLQAAVKDLTPDRHADGIAGKVKGHLDLHAIHLQRH